jgi:hypothetical protein
MTTWSRIGIPTSTPACRSRRVNSRSASLGRGSPGHHRSRGRLPDERPEHLPGVDLHPGQRPSPDLELACDRVPRVEGDHHEDLLLEPAHPRLEVPEDVGRVPDPQIRQRLGDRPAAQLERSRQSCRARDADPRHRRQLSRGGARELDQATGMIQETGPDLGRRTPRHPGPEDQRDELARGESLCSELEHSLTWSVGRVQHERVPVQAASHRRQTRIRSAARRRCPVGRTACPAGRTRCPVGRTPSLASPLQRRESAPWR